LLLIVLLVPLASSSIAVAASPSSQASGLPRIELRDRLKDLEEEALKLLNAEREKAGLSELVLDESLSELAALHASDMFANNFFGHVSRLTGSPVSRARKAGIKFHHYGENLAMASTVAQAHGALMNSPSHKANILNEHYSCVGIAVIRARREGVIIVVQEFLSPENAEITPVAENEPV